MDADSERTSDVVVHLQRDAGGIITAVDDGIVDLLGWRPDELIGRSSTLLIHPEDQTFAVAAWSVMLSEHGMVRTWRGRYRTAAGAWRWVESLNENRLEDRGVVAGTMVPASGVEVSVAEELRARKQVLSRLSEALPVGVIEFDRERAVLFTNGRIHLMLGTAPAATLRELFANVAPDDRRLLEGSVASVFANEPVDGVELRVEVPAHRVCQLSLRALTDSDGVVTGAVGCLADVTDQVLYRRQLEIRASLDPLTSSLNHAAAMELLRWEAENLEHGGVAVIFVDLDRFKSVNDRYGHAAGDAVLVVATERIHRVLRAGDHIGRLGGDEFLVIAPGVDTAETAVKIGKRIAAALDTRIDVGQAAIELSASVGVTWTHRPADAASLVALADDAMYRAKSGGRSVEYQPCP